MDHISMCRNFFRHSFKSNILLSIFSVLVFLAFMPCAFAQSATIDPSIIAGLYADSSQDVAAMDEYEAAVSKLLELERYDLLEKEANADRSEKRRFGGGVWKLFVFYNAVGYPATKTADSKPDWDEHFRKLRRWQESIPDSITARLALAQAHLAFGIEVRGGGFADTVTEEGWKALADSTAKAKQILEDADALPQKCPEWYVLMQSVARNQDWSVKKETELYTRAIAVEPTYFAYYRMHVIFLQPKWNGEEGDSERFAESVAESTEGKLGDILYFEMASELICIRCNDKESVKELSWTRIKRGYQAAEETYGFSIYKLNQLAGLAVAFEDGPFAKQLFEKIGENWDKTTWGSRKFFEANKNWVAELPPDFLLTVREAVKTNLTTPEGRAFDAVIGKEFAEKIGPAITRCMKSGKVPAENFDMFIRLSAGGTPNGGMMVPATDLFPCIAPDTKDLVFSAPPQPDYWVKISMKFIQ